MSRTDDTTGSWRRDALTEGMMLLGDAMGHGAAGAIERQEADGMRALVHSDSLPSDMGDQAAYEALGFTFGPVGESDPLFRPATLPDGWTRKAGGDPRGASILDEMGRERVTIFYKAAFYDRCATMTLIGLHWYVTKHVEYDGPLVLDDEWATREAVTAAMEACRDRILAEAAEFRGYAADKAGRPEDNRMGCAKIADDSEARAAKYSDAIKALGPAT